MTKHLEDYADSWTVETPNASTTYATREEALKEGVHPMLATWAEQGFNYAHNTHGPWEIWSFELIAVAGRVILTANFKED